MAASNWLKETQKGYIRIATLILLSKKPYHGYEIMKEINERTQGFWKPTAGGMYPVLKSLQKSKYIEGEWNKNKGRRKRTYRITKAGRAVLKHALMKENTLAGNLRNLFEEYIKDVLSVDAQLGNFMKIPLPLSELFKETEEKEEDTMKRLEKQCRHIQTTIQQLQERLRTNKQRLREIRQSHSPNRSKNVNSSEAGEILYK